MKKLGRFENLEQIGRGAMGVVYKGWDPYMKRWVALKTMTAGSADVPDQRKRFINEAVFAGNLEHPNIVTIYDSSVDGDIPFIAMTLLEGGSLDKIIQARPTLPLSQKVGYIVYVCRALAHAHRRGIIHRDIKPSNVMLSAEGVVKVVDFGIARAGDVGSSHPGMLIGAPAYMSPELIGGKRADARSDIWAVGVMFYELLTYRRPFVGDNLVALGLNIHSQPTPSILQAAPGTPRELAQVIDRMLKKEVVERYQSVADILLDLEPIWEQIQKVDVLTLVAESKQLLDDGNLPGAQEMARKALSIETGCVPAKNLLEKIKVETRRREIAPLVKEHVERGQNFLAAGQLKEAKAEAVAALDLESTFLPARELLEVVQGAEERARILEQWLRTSKQKFAEGALTDAKLELARVLEIDAENPAAQNLLKQIQEEQARRELQRKLSELLHEARYLLTDLRYDDCIQLLLDAKRELPDETEIAGLLETARQEKAEQDRQAQLMEARNFLRAQKFDEALAALADILGRFPSDITAKNLRALAMEGRAHQIRERQFKSGMVDLRTLIADGKYKEAIAQGEQLSKNFPGEPDLEHLIGDVRNKHAQEELKRRMEQQQQRAREEIRNGRFREAIEVAQAGLKEFPQNKDLKELVESAKARQADKEKRELLDKKIAEIKGKISLGDLTGAIELAQQTLENVGEDAEIRGLRRQAEVLKEEQEKRKQQQQDVLERAGALLRGGKRMEATKVLEEARAGGLLEESDTRFVGMRREIEEKRKQEEKAERDRQQRRMETVRRARTLWTGLRYAECIELMEQAQKEFPGDREIEDLLSRARRDLEEREKAEQDKQRMLGEAKSAIGAGRYEEAISLVEEVLARYPADIGAKTLRVEAQKGRQEQIRERQLREGLASLKKMVEEGRFQDAVARGEKLRLDFPTEAEIEKLVELARNAQIRIECEQRQEHLIEQVRLEIQNGRFREAILAAVAALNEFPENVELAALRESARAQMAEKNRRELKEKRIAEIQSLLFDGSLTAVVDLTDKTLREMGSDREIERLRLKAEAELEEQKKKQRKQKEILEEARGLFNQGKLVDAGKALQQAIMGSQLAENDPRVAALQRDIEERRKQEEKVERDRQQRRMETVRRARTLWTGLRYAECIELMEQAQKEFPGDREIEDLLGRARRDQEEREKAEQNKQRMLVEARNAIGAGRYEEGLRIVEEVLARYPGDIGAKTLRVESQQGQERQKRELEYKEELVSLRKLLEEEQYRQAITRGEKLQRKNPRDVELSAIIEIARNKYEQGESKRRLEQQRQRVEEEVKNRRFREAILEAEAGLKEFPESTDLKELLENARGQQADKEKLEFLDKKIKEIRVKISRGDLKGAIELARQTLTTVGPDSEVRRLLDQAEAELDHRERTKQDQQKLPVPRQVEESRARQDDALAIVERHLATFIGPLAVLIVKKARISSANPVAQLEMIASAISDGADRQIFVQQANRLVECLRRLPPIRGQALSETTTFPPKKTGSIDAQSIETASARLAKYLGPISRFVTEKSVRQADSVQMLYRLLAEHLTNKEDRARFLAESGFPE